MSELPLPHVSSRTLPDQQNLISVAEKLENAALWVAMVLYALLHNIRVLY